MVSHAWLVANRRQKSSIAANIIRPTGIPDFPDLIIRKKIWEKLNVVAMRMAKNDVVDGSQSRSDRAKIGQHPITCAQRQVIVRASVIDQRKIGAANQDTQAGADIYDIHAKSNVLRCVGRSDDARPAFGNESCEAARYPYVMPSRNRTDDGGFRTDRQTTD